MIKEKLRYNKIKKFLEDLNTREQKYIIRKLQKNVLDTKIDEVNFTINGKIVNS